MFRGSTGWAPHETLALLVTCSWAHWRPRRRTQKERIPRRGAERPMSTMWVGEQSGVTQLRSCVFRFSSDQREGRGFYRAVVLIPRLISPTESNYYRYSPIESISSSPPRPAPATPLPGARGPALSLTALSRLREAPGASGESELKRRGGRDRCEVSRSSVIRLKAIYDDTVYRELSTSVRPSRVTRSEN